MPRGESLRTRSDHLLGQVVFLLFILAASLVLAFFYFASSICITVLLAAFLAIVVDPLIMQLERLRISRTLSAALVIITATVLIGAGVYSSSRQISNVVDDMPLYARRIAHAIAPLSRKMQTVRDSAGRLSAEAPTKKVPEVKISNDGDWTSYVIRGAGPVGGVAVIIGVVPFLMFFLLIQKNRLKQKLAILWGERIDVAAFMANVTKMVRGFVVGNLLVASLMSIVTAILLFVLHVDGAPVLGAISGLVNLVPFVGAILGALIPMGAALMQDLPLSTLIIIAVTVVALHTISANFLIPKMIGGRVSISPVAATVGILFWGWLWGIIGVLLAVPLTALVKIIADCHPSFDKVANLLAERPAKVPPWSRTVTVPEAEVPREQPREEAHTHVKHFLGGLKRTRHETT
jgi:predicted PurR-regulated permease PerM